MGHYDKVISTLQAQYKDNIAHVVDVVFAHTQYRFHNLVTFFEDLQKLFEKRITHSFWTKAFTG